MGTWRAWWLSFMEPLEDRDPVMQEPLTLKACGHTETSYHSMRKSQCTHTDQRLERGMLTKPFRGFQRIWEAYGGACVICGPVYCSRRARQISSSRGGPRRMSGRRLMLVLGSCFSEPVLQATNSLRTRLEGSKKTSLGTGVLLLVSARSSQAGTS